MKKTLIIVFLLMLWASAYKVSADAGGYIVKFKKGYVPPDKYKMECINENSNIFKVDNVGFSKDVIKHILYYEPNSKVDLIEGIEPVALKSLPRDELYSEQWQLQMVNADSAWQLETYGNDIRVAVIDSGCYPHEDLKSNLLDGKNYIDDSNDVTDNNGHGTHVSGIIAAEMNDIGITGVAPKAKIVPLKCFDPFCDTYVDTLIQAIYDAVDIYHCKVINMSWGLKRDDPLLEEAIDYAYENGVFCVAAVGNYGSNTLYYPAAYENVIGVGSVGIGKRKSVFSQYNKSVFIVAPGELIKSTYKDGGYASLSGTSQAAPVVSGIVAVLLSMDENVSFNGFKQMLIDTAEDLGEEDYDIEYGYGLVDEDLLTKKTLESIRYYVSPINVDGNQVYVLIKNNTDDILEAVSIFAEYENNKLLDLITKQILLLPYRNLIVKCIDDKVNSSHFLWSDMKSMIPITSKK